MGIGNVEIYERIMIWHIATDLCFYTDSGANEPINKLRREVSKDVSDYMMYYCDVSFRIINRKCNSQF